jgi:NAD-dependent SIR2 family protein deacetylase
VGSRTYYFSLWGLASDVGVQAPGAWRNTHAVSEIDALANLVEAGDVAVLTGAGISTDSGIPDYRGPTGALRSSLPMTIQDFRGSTAARRRYWARSQIGWQRIAGAAPNPNHFAVAALQQSGHLSGVITQNVDGLHQRAGAREVIELHGSLSEVICLECGAVSSRSRLDQRLRAANGELDVDTLASASRPDGDVDLSEAAVDAFVLVGCESCGADLLKPDVVFFGENVPRPRVDRCFELVTGARALLVLGSSLTVMSGLRFVRRAHADGIPVAIVNHGVTRGDPEATVRIDAPLAEVLPALVARVGPSAAKSTRGG